MTKKRISARLDTETIALIDKLRDEGTTRTDVVTESLLNLKRLLFFDKISAEDEQLLLKQQRSPQKTSRTVQLRLSDHLTEYYKLNCYNLTSCIKYAIRRFYDNQ